MRLFFFSMLVFSQMALRAGVLEDLAADYGCVFMLHDGKGGSSMSQDRTAFLVPKKASKERVLSGSVPHQDIREELNTLSDDYKALMVVRRGKEPRQVEDFMKNPQKYLEEAARCWFGTRDAFLARKIKEIRPSGMRVLEVGCGVGLFAFYLASEGVSISSYQGVDQDDLAVHIGTELFQASTLGERFELACQDTETFLTSYRGEPFDFVVSRFANLSNSIAFFQGACRCLKPGGKILATIPWQTFKMCLPGVKLSGATPGSTFSVSVKDATLLGAPEALAKQVACVQVIDRIWREELPQNGFSIDETGESGEGADRFKYFLVSCKDTTTSVGAVREESESGKKKGAPGVSWAKKGFLN